MRIVKYTSILSTLVLILLVGFASKTFAATIAIHDDLANLNQIEDALLSDDSDEHFTEADNEDLNDFEVYMASNEFFDIQKHVILAGAKVHIKVYRKTQSMVIYVGGKKKYSWKTTTGSRARYGKGAVTPAGTYTPYGMTARHHSKKGYTLPYAIKMVGGYFIHGTKAVHMLGKRLSKSVGSHGCMRLSMKNARTLFNLVQKYGRKNTRITVY